MQNKQEAKRSGRKSSSLNFECMIINTGKVSEKEEMIVGRIAEWFCGFTEE